MSQKITKFTKPVLQHARHAGFVRAAEEAVAKVAAEYGLAFSFNNASFNDVSVTFKAEFRVNDPAVAEAAEREDFRMGCTIFHHLNLVPGDYGAFLGSHGGEDVFLIGFNLKKPKYALKGRTATGRIINFTELAARLVVAQRKQAA